MVVIALAVMLFLTISGGWIGASIPFTTLAHDSNIGRETNRYSSLSPALFIIADPPDVKQLEQFLTLRVPRHDEPLPLIKQLQQIDYDRSFAVLVASSPAKSVTVQWVTQWLNRVIIRVDISHYRFGRPTGLFSRPILPDCHPKR